MTFTYKAESHLSRSSFSRYSNVDVTTEKSTTSPSSSKGDLAPVPKQLSKALAPPNPTLGSLQLEVVTATSQATAPTNVLNIVVSLSLMETLRMMVSLIMNLVEGDEGKPMIYIMQGILLSTP